MACVSYGADTGFLPRADVVLVPAQAIVHARLKGGGSNPVVLLGREEDKLRVNYRSWFDPSPTLGKVTPELVELAPVDTILLIGDLPLTAWRPLEGDHTAGAGVLETASAVRGLSLPEDTRLRWEEGGLWAEATLTGGAQVGGRALAMGDRLLFAQGCDVLLRPRAGAEECLALVQGMLQPPE